MTDKYELITLNVFLDGILKISYESFLVDYFNPWDNQKDVLSKISNRDVNKTYKKYCLMKESSETLSMKDYNNVVD